MRNRKDFLRSKLDCSNNFSMRLNIPEAHRHIFNRLADNFRPSANISDDIKNLVSGDLNLCKDRNILIFFEGNSLKLNSLKFYLLINFITNWKPYNEYIVNLVFNDVNNLNSLSFNSASLESIAEMRFRSEDNNILSDIYQTDILYLTVQSNTKIFGEGDFYKDLLRMLLNLRNDQGLITIVIYLGNESSFKSNSFESKLIGVPLKRYNLTSFKTPKSHNNKKERKNQNNSIDESEVF